jgi:hypothetical protein
MRCFSILIALAVLCLPSVAQSAEDRALLKKTTSLYDTPFRRDLASFDCAVTFDWKQHFVDTLGTLPPTAKTAVEKLQSVPHRVFVDRSGAVTSAVPKAPDLSGIPHASELEQAFTTIVSGGLNAWQPFSMGEILPLGATQYHFQK